MFHHIRKFSSTVRAASPISEINKGISAAALRRVIDRQPPGGGGGGGEVGLDRRGLDFEVTDVDDQSCFLEKLPTNQISPPPVGGGGGEVGLDRGSSLKGGCFVEKLFPTTDQISLRPFKVTDVDDLMAWGTDEKLSRYCNWVISVKGGQRYWYCNWIDYEKLLGRLPRKFVLAHFCERFTRPQPFCYFGWELRIYKSKEDALEDIENNIIPHPWFKAICLNNRPIGKIFVDPCARKDPFMAEIGFVVASEHWGKGIATTAVNMVLDTIFNEWPHLGRLQACVNVENLAAHRVLEKAGFFNDCIRKSVGVDETRFLDEGIRERVGEIHLLDKQGRQISIDMKVFCFTRGEVEQRYRNRHGADIK